MTEGLLIMQYTNVNKIATPAAKIAHMKLKPDECLVHESKPPTRPKEKPALGAQ
jgi:hypothetical protein